MERITYRITLDAHRNGIQRTLQGFETADNMSRRIAISLVSGSDTYEIPLDHVTAVVYVTTPNATEPSINECVIEDNTIVYDMLPIVEEGITEMQVKLIETSLDGAKSVLVSPKFAVTVIESGTDDDGAVQTTTFTALEGALARAREIYDSRLLKVEIDGDCTFRVLYADGTVYENGYLKEAIYNGNAVVAESYAIGGTGTREGEDMDNAKYYKNMAEVLLGNTRAVNEDCHDVLDEITEKTIYTAFSIDFESGHLNYLSQTYTFTIDENGKLHYEGISDADKILDDFMAELTNKITTLENKVNALA